MEEDIEYLKKLTKPPLREEWDFAYKLDKKTAQAIENIIKGYREKEESEKYLYDAYQDVGKKMFEYAEENEELKEQVEYLKHEVVLHGSTVEKLVREKMNSIPKSKIKKKIKKLKQQYEDYENKWEKAGMYKAHPFYKYLIRIEAEIDILQELLEEK